MRRRRKAFELQVRKPAEKMIDLLPMKAESVCIRVLMVASVSSGVIRLVCRYDRNRYLSEKIVRLRLNGGTGRKKLTSCAVQTKMSSVWKHLYSSL